MNESIYNCEMYKKNNSLDQRRCIFNRSIDTFNNTKAEDGRRVQQCNMNIYSQKAFCMWLYLLKKVLNFRIISLNGWKRDVSEEGVIIIKLYYVTAYII